MRGDNHLTRMGRLETALVSAQRQIGELQKLNAMLAEQLGETNLKLLYVMRWFKFEHRPVSGLVNAAGQNVGPVERMALEQIYARDRDGFLARILKEAEAHAQQEQQQREAEAAQSAPARRPLSLVGAEGSVTGSNGSPGDADRTDESARHPAETGPGGVH